MVKPVILLFLCLSAVYAQQLGFGGCPNVAVKAPFTASSYLGKWYEAEKYWNFFQGAGKCVTATYTQNGGLIGVFNKQYDINTGAQTNITGSAIVPNATEAKLLVTFPGANFGIPAPYWVLDTDYTSFAVVYSCTNFLFLNFKLVWILTRTPTFNATTLAYATLDKYGIPRSPLTKTDRLNCPVGY